MKVYRIWLSYDLGFDDVAEQLSDAEMTQKYNERYNAFMPWLNEQDARECGYSVATFVYKVEDDVDVESALRVEIRRVFREEEIKDLRGIRMYAIWAKKTPLGSLAYVKSGFIIGERHETNPWD